MRHKVAAKHFNRDANQRKLLFRGLVVDLVTHGQLTTTIERAKEIRRIADKLIHKAQTDSLTSRRSLHRFFGRRDVVNTLVERVAPAMKDRSSGFTRLQAAGTRRGDNSTIVTLSLVTMPETAGTLKSGIKHVLKPAKKVVAKPAAKATKPVVKKAAPKAAAKPTAKTTKAVKAAPKKAAAKKKTA